MTMQAINWALETKTGGPVTKLLLMTLANYANEQGESYPSLVRLAEETEQSTAAVKRNLGKLIERGLIVRCARGGVGVGGRVTNRYELQIPRVRAQSEPKGLGSSEGGVSAHSEGGYSQDHAQPRQEPKNPINPTTPTTANAADQASAEDEREDVTRLCVLLADLIEKNGSKRPTITKAWRDSCRLLLDRDEKTERQVEAAIRWCQQDSFWMGNVLSMPTLRKQYDKLRLKAQQEGWKFTPGPEQPRGLPAELMGDFEAQERYWAELAALKAQKAAQG